MPSINPNLELLVKSIIGDFYDKAEKADWNEFYRLRNNAIVALQAFKKHYPYLHSENQKYLQQEIEKLETTFYSAPEFKPFFTPFKVLIICFIYFIIFFYLAIHYGLEPPNFMKSLWN